MAENIIKVLIATDGIFPYNVGGIQRHSYNLIHHLSVYREFQFYVLHPHKGIKLFDFPNVEEIWMNDLDPKKPYIKECKKYSLQVAEKINSLAPDIIYAQGVTVWEGIESFSEKLIVNPHGLESFQPIGWKEKLVAVLFRKFQKKTFRYARFVISEGGHLTGYLRKIISKEKIIFIPNATNLQGRVIRKKKEKLKCFFLARFSSNKGINILFEAIDILNGKGYLDKIEFNLGGKGPLWQHYDSMTKSPNIKLLGFIDDDALSEHFRKSDVFVFPTLFEGMPTVILEAMSFGLPIIATDVGGIPEIVDEWNGELIRKNDANALAEAIIRFLNLSEEDRERKSKVSHQRIENNFNWEAVARIHVDLFKRMKEELSR